MEQLNLYTKREIDAPTCFVTCKLCLAPQSQTKLIFRNLSEFYNVFKPCGLGLNILENSHYNWVCGYCWTRASQCLQFVEMVRRAEYILHIVLQNEQLTEAKLKEACDGYIKRAVNLSPCFIFPDPVEAVIMPKACETHSAENHEDLNGDFDLLASSGEQFLAVSGVSPVGEMGQAELKPLPAGTESNVDTTEYNSTESTIVMLVDPVWMSCKEEMEEADIVEQETEYKRISKKQLTPDGAKRFRKDPDDLRTRWRLLQVEALTLTEEEQRKELASRRETERYRAWRYKCEQCAVGYHEKESIEKHNKMHDKSRGPYMCQICYMRFAVQHHLSSHMCGHRRRWRCLRCSETIMKSGAVEAHYAKCTGSAPVACDQCGKLYPNKMRLRKHISKLHNSARRRYMCDMCGRAFAEKQTIRNHMRRHTQEKPYECTICGKKTSTSTNHKLHMAVHSKVTEKSDLYCVECDRYFKSKYILRTHFKDSLKHNSSDSFKHACSECDERFSSARVLRVHVNTVHLQLRSHACDLCDKKYYTKSALSAHIKEKHTVGRHAKDHLCTICSRGFFTKSQLKAHSRMHTMERPYSCIVCNATFTFNAALYQHSKLKHKMTPAEVKKKLARN